VGRTDRVSRVMRASPERVFRAFTDPEDLVAWLPPSGMSGRFERADIRPGGSYRLVLTHDEPGHGKTTDDSDVVEVRIIDVVPGESLTQAVDFDATDPAFAGTMTMTWRVIPHPDGARVEIRADDVPRGISAADHEAGITDSLDNLERLVTTPPVE
jgi:uncharacterized protein YndB with AHSA1/START domain